MKTEKEFNDKLKKHLRRARRGLWHISLSRKMDMQPGVYFAYERGQLHLTAYQLYRFMHVTGKDSEYIRQLFDDNWRIPPRYVKSGECADSR